MKGIILAGGTGSRLRPLTNVMNKNLLPVGSKPMLEYPIEKLVEAGITEICIITGAEHMGSIVDLCRSGKGYGCDITYKVQEEAGGIAQAIGLAEKFAGKDDVCILLGDNLFDAPLKLAIDKFNEVLGSVVLVKEVDDPERFGVVEYKDNLPIRIIEKPKDPPSNHAVIGVYLYTNDVFDIIPLLKPSDRGELEVSDINQAYLNQNLLSISEIEGFWIDAGTHESLMEANLWAYKKSGKKFAMTPFAKYAPPGVYIKNEG